MCRGKDHGGRRCPGETGPNAAVRRARQRAAYANAKVARERATLSTDPAPASSPASPGVLATAPDLPPHTPVTETGVPMWALVEQYREALPRFGHPATAEEVQACIAAAREAVALLDTVPSDLLDDEGWSRPTIAGLRAQTAVSHVGAALASHAQPDVDAAVRAARADVSHRPGTSMADTTVLDDPASYGSWLEDRAAQATARVLAHRDHGRLDTPEARADYAEVKALMLEHHEWSTTGKSKWDKASTAATAETYRDVLARFREYRPKGQADMSGVHESSTKAGRKRLEESLAYYPADWHPAADGPGLPLVLASGRSQANYSIRVGLMGGARIERAYIVAGTWEIGHAPPGVAVMLHEYGHHAQEIRPHLLDVETVFLAVHTTGEDGRRDPLEPLSQKAAAAQARGRTPVTSADLTGDVSRQRWGRSDHFVAAYVGRYGGLSGNGKWERSTAHRDFTLGALAVL